MPENLPIESVDAAKPIVPAEPASPPAGYLSGLDITEEMIEGANWRDKDRLIVARAQAREVKRLENEKAAKESAESSKRAKAAVDEVVERGEREGEEQKDEPQLLKPGAFTLEVPDTLTESQKEVAAGYAEDVAAIATDAGIGQDEAQVILDTARDIAATIMPNGDEPNLANADECMSVMHSRWGEVATKELIADSNKAVARLGKDVEAWLNQPNEFGEQIGNSPAAVFALAMWQRGYTRMSPEKAASEVARLRGTKEYQSGDKKYTDAVALVSKIAARGQSRELAMPRPTAPAARPAIQQEIDKIRQNPDYTSMDSKKRAPLVARVNALYAQLG
jgi:hypothetical protein